MKNIIDVIKITRKSHWWGIAGTKKPSRGGLGGVILLKSFVQNTWLKTHIWLEF